MEWNHGTGWEHTTGIQKSLPRFALIFPLYGAGGYHRHHAIPWHPPDPQTPKEVEVEEDGRQCK